MFAHVDRKTTMYTRIYATIKYSWCVGVALARQQRRKRSGSGSGSGSGSAAVVVAARQCQWRGDDGGSLAVAGGGQWRWWQQCGSGVQCGVIGGSSFFLNLGGYIGTMDRLRRGSQNEGKLIPFGLDSTMALLIAGLDSS